MRVAKPSLNPDEWSGTSSNPLDQRSREQLRFDTNRIEAILREHEKILVQGFEGAR